MESETFTERVCKENVYRSKDPKPIWYGCISIVVSGGEKIPVVVRKHQKVQRSQKKTGKRHRVWSHRTRKKL